MNQKPYSNHLSWHITAGMLIAFFMAFIALHGYSMNPYLKLNFFEQIWRTISYVIPKWLLIIIPAGLIVSALSWAMYGLIRKLEGEQRKTSTAVYFILTVLGAGFFLLVFNIFSLFILIPVYLECQILSRIVGSPDAEFEEKRKVEDLMVS